MSAFSLLAELFEGFNNSPEVFKPLSGDDLYGYAGAGEDTKIATVALDGSKPDALGSYCDVLYGIIDGGYAPIVSVHVYEAYGDDKHFMQIFDTVQQAETVAKNVVKFIKLNQLITPKEICAYLLKLGFERS